MRGLSLLLLTTAPLMWAGCGVVQPIDLINWNTYHLFDHQKHKVQAADWLRRTRPSMVALQEVLHVNGQGLSALSKTWGHPYAVMHKESGYPVALTSSAPITVVERRTAGFHHGYLHARTHGYHVFVVHFWPNKVHEAEHVARVARRLLEAGESVLVVGDFNAEIRHDEVYLQRHGHQGKVVDGQRVFDYRITDAFLDSGFVDVVHQRDPDAHYTFGSPALIPRWRKDLAGVHTSRRRIDYVFADSKTANSITNAEVITNDQTVGLWSDHYPIKVRLRQ